ncbi:MAG TPA: hypothetical protein VG015_05475, partial [Candidatus Dormibacteraeota bacterium]|nr:hypothetical protein [Candidatus Dormibacteraeota bacterium]
ELLDQGLEAHTVSEVWLGASADPDLFIDALPWLDRKMEAILCHVSQFLGRPEFDAGEFKKLIGERMKQMGEMAGLEVAEGFRRVEAG